MVPVVNELVNGLCFDTWGGHPLTTLMSFFMWFDDFGSSSYGAGVARHNMTVCKNSVAVTLFQARGEQELC